MSEFVYGSKSTAPDYVTRGGSTYRVISDQLGSPRYVVNVANASEVPLSATYTSFGVVTGVGLDWMPFGFAGGIYDGETGLVRFGARDYDPVVGWTSKDPIRFDAQGANLYVYADADPVNSLDYTGRNPAAAAAAAAGAAAGAAGAYIGGKLLYCWSRRVSCEHELNERDRKSRTSRFRGDWNYAVRPSERDW